MNSFEGRAARARRALEQGGYWPTPRGIERLKEPGEREAAAAWLAESVEQMDNAALFAIAVLANALAGEPDHAQ